MSAKRVCYIVAAVLFVLAWLVSLGTIDASGEFFAFQSLVALGLAVGFTGHAL